jgi:hypothetical protein
LKLPTDEGTGHYLSTIDLPFVTTCIKRESGQINGTTDFTLVPPLTIKNCLPCALKIGYKNRPMEDDYIVEESQEKQFHIFAPTRATQ